MSAPYSDFVARLLLAPGLLEKLTPTDPLAWDWPAKIRDASDAALIGGTTIADARMFVLVRGALHYAVDDLEGAHRIFQDDSSDHGSYWHGMLHRREGDFDNARYWFRRAGRLGPFEKMHAASRECSYDMAKQPAWDAYLFTGMCEQAKFGAHEALAECVALQRIEFDAMLAHCWAAAVAGAA